MDAFAYLALRFILYFYGIVLVLGPIVLRTRFRLRARFDPCVVSLEELPVQVREFLEPRAGSLALWNFDLVAYLNLGQITPTTATYMALLSNPHTCEWADITVIFSPLKKTGYIEFITRCSEEVQIDTNTASAAPGLFSVPQHQVFRFPEIQDVYTLYRVHRMLVTDITHGALPVLPPPGQEVAELKRRLERFGPWQQEHGYMYPDATGENYRLTWKGAIFAAWRKTWPVPLVRGWRMQRKNQAVLDRIAAAS
jgi:hypothetical protein